MALNTRFEGSNPAKGDGFLRTIKIRSTLSFRLEVKPSAPCRKILRYVKIPFRTKILLKAKFIFSSPVTPALLLEDCAGMIARELWWTNQEFFLVDIIPTLYAIFTYHVGDEQ
jgi:hypothetical protein